MSETKKCVGEKGRDNNTSNERNKTQRVANLHKVQNRSKKQTTSFNVNGPQNFTQLIML